MRVGKYDPQLYSTMQLAISPFLRDSLVHEALYLGHTIGEIVCKYIAKGFSEAEEYVSKVQSAKTPVLVRIPADQYDQYVRSAEKRNISLTRAMRSWLDAGYYGVHDAQHIFTRHDERSR